MPQWPDWPRYWTQCALSLAAFAGASPWPPFSPGRRVDCQPSLEGGTAGLSSLLGCWHLNLHLSLLGPDLRVVILLEYPLGTLLGKCPMVKVGAGREACLGRVITFLRSTSRSRYGVPEKNSSKTQIWERRAGKVRRVAQSDGGLAPDLRNVRTPFSRTAFKDFGVTSCAGSSGWAVGR